MTQRTILLSAGASGGHLFPALAVADELRARGYQCVFVVGGNKFTDLVAQRGYALESLPAAAFANRGPLGLIKAVWALGKGLGVALSLVRKYRPVAAYGTGGYATVATLLAAKVMGVPVVIHNLDVLMGRANRLLAPLADAILLSVEATRRALSNPNKARVVGLPLRHEVIEALAFKRNDKGPFNLLVLGGSQGSSVLGVTIPEALGLMDKKARTNLSVTHQCRAADETALRKAYAATEVKKVTIQPFFNDLPARMVQAHFIIARAGMGTLAEAFALGRAAIYCPHRLADNHQHYNAEMARAAGAAVVLTESEFTPANLARVMESVIHNPRQRAAMEKAALAQGHPDAATASADEIEQLLKGHA